MDLPLHPDCRVLRADSCGLVAVEKATGVLSHPNTKRDSRPSLLDLPFDPEGEIYSGEGCSWHLLNRLDAPTSGILLLSSDPGIATAVRKAFATHQVGKTYAAVVKGVPMPNRQKWRDRLLVIRRGGKLRTTVVRGNPDAETSMECLKRADSPPARSLLRLKPVTGRTHQLRVQCASRHLPIIGDGTYGDFRFNREFRKKLREGRLYLHSWKTHLQFNYGGGMVDFYVESPLPAAFAVALD